MDSNNKLNFMHIIVKGIHGSGKSILIYEIKEFLKSKGVEVFYEPEPDFKNIEDFNERMENKPTDILTTVVKSVEITEISTYE